MSGNKSLKIGIGTSILLLVSFGIYHSISVNQKEKAQSLKEDQKSVSYSAQGYIVQPRLLADSNEYQGTIALDHKIVVSATADGLVKNCRFQKGLQVQKGQLLIAIDNAILQNNQLQNRNNYQKAQKDYQNLKALSLNGNATGQEVANAKLQMQNAATQININKNQIHQTFIYAPSSGIIVDQKIHYGEYANIGQPIATIANLNQVLATFYVEQATLSKLQKGQILEFIPDAFPQNLYEGKIESIIPLASEAGTFPVNIRISNQNAPLLMEGMTGKVILKNSAVERLQIPRIAIVGDPQHPQVFVYHAHQQPQLKSIQIDHILNQFVQVKSGLAVGDTILISGQQNISAHNVLRNIVIK